MPLTNINKPGAVKVGAIPKAHNAQTFLKVLRTFSRNNSQKSSKKTKGAFGARETLTKFGYSLLRHMLALFSILRLLLGKTQIHSDITSQKIVNSMQGQMGALDLEQLSPP